MGMLWMFHVVVIHIHTKKHKNIVCDRLLAEVHSHTMQCVESATFKDPTVASGFLPDTVTPP